jgi:3-deoxy-manno-octulosonate cytidylyltransferase (CMP-KDO synthetase)
MTSRKHTSGTDRIAEVARRLRYPIVVNLQADEPEIDPRIIDRVIKLVRLKEVDIATLACPFRNKEELNDSAKVKVLVDAKGFAIDFFRNPNPPLLRGDSKGDCLLLKRVRGINRHIGIYAYKKQALLKFTKLSPTSREKEEKLEQLRALENGFRIKVGLIKKAPAGIDTPRDYAQFVRRMSLISTHLLH